MMKPKFNLNSYDKSLMDLIDQVTHQRTGVWALMCAKRVLPFYIDLYPQDQRPKIALETLQNWITTGEFRVNVIRKAALDSHAAAREVGEDNPARSAARAAAQAVSTAHVRKHAIAASSYATQAIHRAARDSDAERLVAEERDWQKRTLLDLMDHRSAFE